MGTTSRARCLPGGEKEGGAPSDVARRRQAAGRQPSRTFRVSYLFIFLKIVSVIFLEGLFENFFFPLLASFGRISLGISRPSCFGSLKGRPIELGQMTDTALHTVKVLHQFVTFLFKQSGWSQHGLSVFRRSQRCVVLHPI